MNCWPGVLKCITEGSLPTCSSQQALFFLKLCVSHVFRHPFVTVINCLIRITLHVSNCSLLWSGTACSGQAQEFSSVVFVFFWFLLLTMNKVVVCLTQLHLLKRTKKWDVRTKQRMFCFVFVLCNLR